MEEDEGKEEREGRRGREIDTWLGLSTSMLTSRYFGAWKSVLSVNTPPSLAMNYRKTTAKMPQPLLWLEPALPNEGALIRIATALHIYKYIHVHMVKVFARIAPRDRGFGSTEKTYIPRGIKVIDQLHHRENTYGERHHMVKSDQHVP